MRFNFPISPILDIPLIIDKNTTGTTIILMSFKNKSPIGCNHKISF